MKTKEGVVLSLAGVTDQQPYRSYYEQRNGRIATDIARLLGIPYLGTLSEVKHNGLYYVPPKTVERKRDRLLESDFYGTALSNLHQIGKAILHPSVSLKSPAFHSQTFARLVTDNEIVLPGITAFTREDLYSAYRAGLLPMRRLRLKVTEESDGHGQYPLLNELELRKAAEKVPADKIAAEGLVLEPDLAYPSTVSVGLVILGGKPYSFIARQLNDIDPVDGRSRYLGARVTTVTGGLENLPGAAENRAEQNAVEKSTAFYRAYSYFRPVVSRISFDCLSGFDSDGSERSGITDITGRLGGTCPALMQAISILRDIPEGRVDTQVNLIYDPVKDGLKPVAGFTTYIDTPTLKIVAGPISRL